MQSSLKQVRGMRPSELVLLLSSLPRLTVVYLRHLNTLSSLPLFAKTFGVSLPIVFHTVYISVQRNIALLFWRYSMTAETHPFGWLEPNPVRKNLMVSKKGQIRLILTPLIFGTRNFAQTNGITSTAICLQDFSSSSSTSQLIE